nr:RNA 2',3'-cyclic phosphodiesterase [Nanoarchaeum sp.]
MRLFIAVELPKEIKDDLYRIQKSINPEFAKINWVSKKNLHLSLKFIGEYKDVDIIRERLSNIKFDKFEVKLDLFGVFPDENNIRVMWVGLEPKNKIIELQKEVDQELIDLLNKDQKFSPHLTLGRVKSIKNKNEFLKSLKSVSVNNLTFEINSFYLMQSELTKDGPIYKKLEMFKA